MQKRSEQLLRKLKFVAEVKKNNYPNAESFARQLALFEDEEGQPFACSARTIARDIKELVEVHKAPLEYDPQNRGYYLRDRAWEFNCPVFEQDFVSMAMLGTRLSADLLPAPLQQQVDDAVAQLLATNSSDFFDLAMIESILCASGNKTSIDPVVFKKLFDAWRRKQMVELVYRNPKGEESTHRFEPHLIAFHKGAWYAKGYLYQTREMRIFAAQRIVSLRNGCASFETDKKLLADTKANGLFNYPKIEGIRLHCDAEIAFYIYEQQKVMKSDLQAQADGSLILGLRPTVEHDVMRWILAEAGRVQVLEPAWLREKVAAAGRAIAENNS